MILARDIRHSVKSPEADDVISLGYEDRFLRRKRLTTDSGLAFLVELPRALSLSATDGFILEDGRIIAIVPKPEPLLKISHEDLPRLAWHIGNRHTPCQFAPDHLLIQADHVLETLMVSLGAQVEPLTAPFQPEGGAYGHGRTHSHNHDHTHTSQPESYLSNTD